MDLYRRRNHLHRVDRFSDMDFSHHRRAWPLRPPQRRFRSRFTRVNGGGKFGIPIAASVTDTFTTANEIHIPVGQPVRFELKSPDVIHSFWIPQLAGKTDVIPGQTNVSWMQADAAGTYRGQCAEYLRRAARAHGAARRRRNARSVQRLALAQRHAGPAPASELQKAGTTSFSPAAASATPFAERTAQAASVPTLRT